MIPWTDLNDSTSDLEIDSQLAHLDSLGHSFAWFVYGHDQPRNLVDVLLARGLEVDSQAEVVIAGARELRDHFPSDEVQLRRIDAAAQIADLLRVQQVVWGDEHVEFVTRWLTKLVVDAFEESNVLVAYVQEEPVAAAWSTLWTSTRSKLASDWERHKESHPAWPFPSQCSLYLRGVTFVLQDRQ